VRVRTRENARAMAIERSRGARTKHGRSRRARL